MTIPGGPPRANFSEPLRPSSATSDAVGSGKEPSWPSKVEMPHTSPYEHRTFMDCECPDWTASNQSANIKSDRNALASNPPSFSVTTTQPSDAKPIREEKSDCNLDGFLLVKRARHSRFDDCRFAVNRFASPRIQSNPNTSGCSGNTINRRPASFSPEDNYINQQIAVEPPRRRPAA